MGLFDFFRKKEKPQESTVESKLLLSMPMFKNGDRYSIEQVIAHLKKQWGMKVDGDDYSDDTAILTIEGSMVAIAYMSAAIPREDIEATAKYTYSWSTAMEDLEGMTGHVIVSVMVSDKSTYDRYMLMSKVLYSILATSNAVGVYQGGQTLLISREEYLSYEDRLMENDTPLTLWVYIGIRVGHEDTTLYTYGMEEFGFKELEIIQTRMATGEAFSFLCNVCCYVLESNVRFRDGETFGYTEEQRISITLSKGVNLNGETLKLGL
ncbi:hypothetical protein AS361_02830 [Myroides marinus]|uniref:DUF4261 domain-containing protein n=1 Tax=Myroides marinus TaxID=703342 RepID=UPI0007422917|nr:DUF4261 domain-containing protein [Myroides marinus]KUF44338.1 hypothetical protein AS361_02830 [Myroides marinus]